MTQAVTIEIGGLKCDADGCDYIDHSARRENYKQYIDAPCPKCGAPLLTQADMDTVIAIEVLTNTINRIVQPPEGSPTVCVEVKMNGSGGVEFVKKKGAGV